MGERPGQGGARGLRGPAGRGAFDVAARAMAPRYGWVGCAVVPLCHSENRTYLVRDAASGAPVATLRICRPGYRGLGELAAELGWLLALRDEVRLEGVELCEPLAARDGSLIQRILLPGGETLHGVAFAYMPGCAPDEADAAAMRRLFGRLGGLAAALHGCDALPRGAAVPVGAVRVDGAGVDRGNSGAAPETLALSRPTWDAGTCLGAHATWGDWRAFEGLGAQAARLLSTCEARVRRALEAYGKPRRCFGLIHADMRLANLLVNDGTLGLIDFDDCAYSWHLFDLAASLSFIEARPDMPDLAAAWLEEYRRARPLDMPDLAVVSSLVMVRRLQLTGWLASRHDSDPVEGFSRGWARDTLALAERYLADVLLPDPLG